ncbi:hypothetical protein K458DRAFT_419049 [Lentithecium fluviatile CBS 122367]|uniref:Nucleolar protein Dnt1-like N-terminal domain-containing protein n=1 Tax=Lentithecium fluviatile CBS 122367 TaxID=1168545 RepID=A0A6G1IZY6_9PLEO|nr:hypothetical protein K458DRAFT_419049 [Lentithecium fluviatile CBS 122367]
MAASNNRMRLIVEVLPLLVENAHGPHQAAAMAAFKGRKFALPVQTDHTFEQVWRQIEERYKRNYLSPAQAACFIIEKLQDAYGCDLDLGDTVGDIFEGEINNHMRMIKVVPSFINRDFSMPVTTNLRPMSASKRIRETTVERTSKRRRLEEEQRELMDLDPARDRPLASTESDRSVDKDMERANLHRQTGRSRSRRSNTGSLVFVKVSQTGNQEFVPQVKEESPELGMPPPRTIPESHGQRFKKPLLPASRLSTAVHQQTSSPASASRRSSTETRPQGLLQEGRIEQGAIDHAGVENDDAQVGLDNLPSPHEDPEEAAILQSPNSTPDQVQIVVSQSASRRQRVYGMPGSPPFMKPKTKPSATYSRSPNNPNDLERDVSLLNSSRPHSKGAQMKANGQSGTQRRSSNVHSFQLAEPDEIESTPQGDTAAASRPDARVENTGISMEDAGEIANGTSGLDESPGLEPKKMGSLIKPKQKAYNISRMPKAIQGCTDSDTRSKSTSMSASTASSDASRVSPSVRSGMVSLPRRIIRATSPKVLISKKVSSKISRLQAQAPVGPDKHADSDSHRATNGMLPRPSSVSGTNTSGFTKSTQTSSTPLLVKVHAIHKRTPIPLPENVRHLYKVDTSHSGQSSTPRKRGRPLKYPNAPPKTPRPRGRPRKEPILAPPKESNPDPSEEVSPAPGKESVPVPRKGRGRPRKDPGNAAVSTGAKSLSSQRKAKPIATKPPPMSTEANGTTKDAIILSSGGSSPGDSNAGNGGTETGAPIAKLTTPDPSEDPPSELKITPYLEKKHTGVMARLFPEGHEKARKKQNPTREIFGSPIARMAKKRSDVVGDAETSLDANVNVQIDSADMELQLQNAAAMDYMETSESPEPQVEISKDLDNEPTGQETDSKPAPWDSTSWGFGAVDQQNEVTEQAQVEIASRSRSKSTASSNSEGTTESEPESDAEAVDEAKSKSASAANSTRSSPEVSRQPARYLSHSPTPAKSDSDEESETSRSRSPSRVASPKVAKGVEDGSDESSGGSDSSDESESENEDVEMADADPPSSPPGIPPRPITLVPATQSSQLRGSSQPGLRRDPAAIPSNTPLASATQPTPRVSSARPTNVKPIPRRTAYSKFSTLSEQLNELRANPQSAQTLRKFNPKTQNLTQLKGGKKLPFGDDDDSEEESSSESSGEEEGGKGKNGGLCSVA